jgi:outer membrane protein TolC
VTLAMLAGCKSTSPPPIDSESVIGNALGLGSPIAFRIEGGPLDEPGDHDRLTLADATHLAATTDPGLQMAIARVRAALADADQARLLPNPILNLIFKFPTSGGKPSIEAELSGDIVSMLQIPRRASAADNRLRAGCAEALTTALAVVAEAQERYATVQALDELMPVLEARRRLLDRLLELSRDRLEAGEGTRSDVTTLEAQRVELDVEIAGKRQEQRDERLRLSRLIGQPSGEAAWVAENWQAPQYAAANEPAWIDTALVHRPEVQAAVWELAALGDDLALTKFAPFDGSSAGVKADRDDGWSVGPSITVPIPIFDVGQAKRAKATAMQIEARHKLTQARRQVVEDVRRAYQSLAAAQANLERVRKELIPLQEQRRSQAEDAYRAGQTDVTALFLAEQDLQASLAKRVELEQTAAVSLVRLERAVGGGGIAAQIGAPPPPAPSPPSGTSNKSASTNNPK